MQTLRFKHKKGIIVDIEKADIYNRSADILILGRNDKLKNDFENISGHFVEYLKSNYRGRSTYLLETNGKLPWKYILSIDYSPRNTKPHLKYSEHTNKLADHIKRIIKNAIEDLNCKKILIMPLSCRGPENIAIATICGIHRYISPFGLDLMFNQLTDMFFDITKQFIKASENEMKSIGSNVFDMAKKIANESEEDARNRLMSINLNDNIHFQIIDIDDPAPFIDAITNKSGCLTMKNQYSQMMPEELWEKEPFVLSQCK